MVANTSSRLLTDRWRRLIDALESDWVFRWPSMALYAIIAIPFVSVSEYNRLVTPTLVEALGIATLSVSLVVVLLAALRPVIGRIRRHRVAALMTSLVFIGLARAVIVTNVIDAIDINRGHFGVSRALLSAGAVPTLFVVSVFIIATIAKGWRERNASRREIAALLKERDTILSELAKADEVLIAESEGTLRPAVAAIMQRLHIDTRQSVGLALENLVSGVIRPLSHSLAAGARTRRVLTEHISAPINAPAFPTADGFVGPLVAAAAVYLTTVVILFDVVPLLEGLVTALIGASLTWLGLRIFQALLTGLTLTLRSIVSIVVLAHLGIGLIVAWVDVSLFTQYGVGTEITLAMVAAALVPGLLYVAQRFVTHMGEVRSIEMSTARREMALQVSEVRRRAWLRQRHIAHALHSAIQSRVHAESRLVLSGNGPMTAAEAERVEESLESMFDLLRNSDDSTSDSLGELNRAVEFWAGMCEIDFTIDSSARERIAADADLGETVLVTCLEIINNAIRHGKATSMSLAITTASFDMIRVDAANNGTAVGEHQPGLGMSMFDELTVHWNLASGEGTTFTGHIASRPPTRTGVAKSTNA